MTKKMIMLPLLAASVSLFLRDVKENWWKRWI
mgnify:CR=1 FL=1